MNSFLSFYRKHNISPVKQDITDIRKHFNKRASLYRELGILKNFIENSDVLEVGPGGGYNSIIVAMQNPRSYTLVEPNYAGYKEMLSLFNKNRLFTESTFFINDIFEDANLDIQYDLVICEGLIPGLENKSGLISKLKNSVKSGGILVLTTADEISGFFDIARRFIANKLIENIVDIKQKIIILSEAFELHLSSLGTPTRSVEDWVLDVLLNPASSNAEHYYSMSDALKDLGEEFFYFSSSPNLFTNQTWYKKLEYEPDQYNKKYISQFKTNRHSLILQEYPITHRPQKLNDELSALCSSFGVLSKKAENNELNFGYCEKEIILIVKSIVDNLQDESIKEILSEFIYILQNTTIDNIRNMKKFKSAFGKGQQYMSFVKC